MSDDVISFTTTAELWAWLAEQDATHPGVWVRIGKTRSSFTSITFHDLLEAGLAHGWSESDRRGFDHESYLQRFSPRRTRGTASERNRTIVQRLESEGRLTPAGRAALGLD